MLVVAGAEQGRQRAELHAERHAALGLERVEGKVADIALRAGAGPRDLDGFVRIGGGAPVARELERLVAALVDEAHERQGAPISRVPENRAQGGRAGSARRDMAASG